MAVCRFDAIEYGRANACIFIFSFAQRTTEPDFLARRELDSATLVSLFAWDEAEFLRRTEGSAIRRIGHERWLRNLAVALGNAPPSAGIRDALLARAEHASALVREHVNWSLRALESRGEQSEE